MKKLQPRVSIIIPYLPNSKYIDKILDDIPLKVKSSYEVIVLDWPESVNWKWNQGVKTSNWDYIFIINDDIVLTKWLDLELIKGLENHKIACPLSTIWKEKFKLPMIQARSENIAGWCYMLKKEDWKPIPKELNLWYWDNFIYEINNRDICWVWLCHHYESSTIKTMDVSQIIAQDKINWHKVVKEYWFDKPKQKKRLKLSILIPSVPSRLYKLEQLMDRLNKQITDECELIVYTDNKIISLWSKRNKLLSLANWEYSVMIDDDDEITDDYVSELLKWIESNADVICYKMTCSENWWEAKPVYFSKESKNITTKDAHYRKPSHLMCYKTELARSVKYRDIRYWEDFYYSEAITPLINTEYLINKVLYHYIYNEKTTECPKTNLTITY